MSDYHINMLCAQRVTQGQLLRQYSHREPCSGAANRR
jgi:hypothetical protein